MAQTTQQRIARNKPKPPEPTDPGDRIEVSITAEVKTRRGTSFWAKVGLASEHRDNETSKEAYERVATFCIDRVDELTTEMLS